MGPILEDLYYNDFNYVLLKYQLTYGEVLGILDNYISNEYLDTRLDYYRKLLKRKKIFTSIKANRVGIISDTHIGNSKTRWDYIEAAYDFFYYNDIEVVLHLGDLLDGFQKSDNVQSEVEKVRPYFQEQLNDFQMNYPQKIFTYILLGNHDERFRHFGFDLFKELPALNKEVCVLAYGGYRFQINDHMFYLSHPIQNVYYVLNNGCELNLRGHSHYFEYDARRKLFRLNTCSDAHPNPATADYELAGGFSVLSFPKKRMCFENYSFYHDDIVKSLCLKL